MRSPLRILRTMWPRAETESQTEPAPRFRGSAGPSNGSTSRRSVSHPAKKLS